MRYVEPIKNIKDINNIKDYLKQESLRNYLLFIIGINTGMKTCMMLNLKFVDLLDINYNVKSNIIINNTKYQVTYTMIKAIQEYKELKNIQLDDYIFKSNKGEFPIDRSHLYRILNNAAEQCNVDISIGIETLRKTFGYHYFNQTGDIDYLQSIFNKASKNKLYEYLSIDTELSNFPKFYL